MSSSQMIKSTLRSRMKEFKHEPFDESDSPRDEIYISLLLKLDDVSNASSERWVKLDDVLEAVCIDLDGRMVTDKSFKIDYYINKDGKKVPLDMPMTISSGDIDDCYEELPMSGDED